MAEMAGNRTMKTIWNYNIVNFFDEGRPFKILLQIPLPKDF